MPRAVWIEVFSIVLLSCATPGVVWSHKQASTSYDFYLKCVGTETMTWKDGVKTKASIEDYYHVHDGELYKLLDAGVKPGDPLDFLVAEWESACADGAECVIDEGKIELNADKAMHLTISRLTGDFYRWTNSSGSSGIASTYGSGKCIKVGNPKPKQF
jgi:hypothetical protein